MDRDHAFCPGRLSRPENLEAEPEGLLAARLTELASAHGSDGLIMVARSETRAARLSIAIRALEPGLASHLLPAWDCLPYDRVSPSREVMGRRMAVVHAIAARKGAAPLVVASLDAAMRRLPPPEVWDQARLGVGDPIDPAALEQRLSRLGYTFEDPVEAPGEAAVRGAVIDLYSPTESLASRIEYADGAISSIRRFDPLSQRSEEEASEAVIGPASEVILTEDAEADRPSGAEHFLARYYAQLVSLFDLLPRAVIALDPEIRTLHPQRYAEAEESWWARLALNPSADEMPTPPAPAVSFLDQDAWRSALDGREVIDIAEAPDEPAGALPRFREQTDPEEALLAFVEQQLANNRRVGIAAAPRDRILRMLARELDREPVMVAGWRALHEAEPGTLARMPFGLPGGFTDAEAVVVAAADVHAIRARSPGANDAAVLAAESQLQPGDAVVHIEHGLGALSGIETVAVDGIRSDFLRLEYAGGARTLVPLSETDRIWRYGAGAEGLGLDRLGSDAWPKRREQLIAEIAETAARLVALARVREQARAPVLQPPRRAYARFTNRFAYEPTPDQAAAIEEVLRDLALGRPMDRLVCGDVGFGKTEVALRAAAAAALSGYQVAVLAPTTVLVRQHLNTFRQRFAGFGIRIEALSRLSRPAEARETKAGLADGSVAIAIGTHALAGRGVCFRNLALLIVDEEQRFGTRQKAALRRIARDVHVLTLTATPIPRTLQAAMVGLRELSVIATPPAPRQPVRTIRATIDPVLIGNALRREKRRSGQSFVVCPRIEDLPSVRPQIAAVASALRLIEAHGKMPADAVDQAIVRFAEGDGDVLLSTNIIEAGLDIPRANTILVWNAERFGLADLHQLRGRVGRGRARGIAYLLGDATVGRNAAAQKRLRALETMDRLGAGFAISARDLDVRGAGDLLGEAQSGHLKLVGLELYRHLLDRAMRLARGEPLAADWTPELNLGLSAYIPEEYVPEAPVRIGLYLRLGSIVRGGEKLDDLAEEIEDRFGPLPAPVANLLGLARVGLLCRRLGIARLDVGPNAAAATLRPGVSVAPKPPIEERGDRLILARASSSETERLAVAEALVALLARIARGRSEGADRP